MSTTSVPSPPLPVSKFDPSPLPAPVHALASSANIYFATRNRVIARTGSLCWLCGVAYVALDSAGHVFEEYVPRTPDRGVVGKFCGRDYALRKRPLWYQETVSEWCEIPDDVAMKIQRLLWLYGAQNPEFMCIIRVPRADDNDDNGNNGDADMLDPKEKTESSPPLPPPVGPSHPPSCRSARSRKPPRSQRHDHSHIPPALTEPQPCSCSRLDGVTRLPTINNCTIHMAGLGK